MEQHTIEHWLIVYQINSVLLCVAPFSVTFIAPLATAVTHVYVCNKMGKLRESVKIYDHKHVNNM